MTIMEFLASHEIRPGDNVNCIDIYTRPYDKVPILVGRIRYINGERYIASGASALGWRKFGSRVRFDSALELLAKEAHDRV